MEDNFKSIPQYSTLKGVTKRRIYDLIESKHIETTLVGGKQYIDMTRYGDFDPAERVRSIVKVKKVEDDVLTLKKRVRNLEAIVYASNDEGRGKGKKE
jgi:hypothetical protein